MRGASHNLNFYAKSFLKTKIRLNHRSFSDFTIEELNDYAACVYHIGIKFHLSFKEFFLNRIEKTFSFAFALNQDPLPPTWLDDLEMWEWNYSFLQYLFNIEGAEKFEYLTRATKIKLTRDDKKYLNKYGEKFCDGIWFDLWNLFSQHSTVKQKVLEYFRDIGMIKQHKCGGYARLDMSAESWDTGKLK